MEYEPFEVSYTAGQPYVGATLTMMPAGADVITGKPDGTTNLGQFTAYDAKTGKIAWSNKEAILRMVRFCRHCWRRSILRHIWKVT